EYRRLRSKLASMRTSFVDSLLGDPGPRVEVAYTTDRARAARVFFCGGVVPLTAALECAHMAPWAKCSVSRAGLQGLNLAHAGGTGSPRHPETQPTPARAFILGGRPTERCCATTPWR